MSFVNCCCGGVKYVVRMVGVDVDDFEFFIKNVEFKWVEVIGVCVDFVVVVFYNENDWKFLFDCKGYGFVEFVLLGCCVVCCGNDDILFVIYLYCLCDVIGR